MIQLPEWVQPCWVVLGVLASFLAIIVSIYQLAVLFRSPERSEILRQMGRVAGVAALAVLLLAGVTFVAWVIFTEGFNNILGVVTNLLVTIYILAWLFYWARRLQR